MSLIIRIPNREFLKQVTLCLWLETFTQIVVQIFHLGCTLLISCVWLSREAQNSGSLLLASQRATVLSWYKFQVRLRLERLPVQTLTFEDPNQASLALAYRVSQFTVSGVLHRTPALS